MRKTFLGLGRVWLWEALKLQLEISYRAGWIVGFMAGTFGIYREPTDEEVRSCNVMLDSLNRFEQEIKAENLKEKEPGS